VLMDGGSSLNILYAHTLRLMGIGLDKVWPSTTPFHGVAPGRRVQSPANTTMRQTNSRRSRRGESPFPKTFSCKTSLSRPSTSDQNSRVRRNPRGLPRTQRVRNPWTRTPRMRRSYFPCSRGMARTKPRPWRQSPPPRGGLAG
jgi:hypothetical protein